MRIYAVLRDREEWLREQGYPVDYKLTWRERGDFYRWILRKFQRTAWEQGLITQARRDGKSDREIKRGIRSRWSLEMQRRAGTPQFWQLLSFNGDFTPEFLSQALEPHLERLDTETEAEQNAKATKAKADLRHGTSLQRREERDPEILKSLKWWELDLLKEVKDGTLKRKVNSAVRDCGHGRLRGEDKNDYLDIGTNRETAMVNQMIDGKRRRKDTSRFQFAD